MVTYNRTQLKNLIDGAKALGFWDEVVHFTELLRQLDASGGTEIAAP
jgi:hypothetical protein